MTLSAGARLGPYEIVGLIGAGGMGEVYRARDPRLGREVAVKVLPAAFSLDSNRQRRFEREARAAAALNHPNILAVYDIGTDGDRTYVVSELLRGETLRGRLSGGALSPRKTVEYAIQIAHGLAAAHDTGIVHRDLKPENLFVTADGHVKILDFGLAKTSVAAMVGDVGLDRPTETFNTDIGVVLGTVGYMSPEQVNGQPTDHRTDIFTLGAICHEMLTGARAFDRPSAAETMTAILREDPPDLAVVRSDVPPALQQIVRHCLEKRPEERFQSTRDLAFALEAVAQASGPDPALVATVSAPPRLRRSWSVAMAVVAALAGVLATWAVMRPAPPPSRPVSRFAIVLPAHEALAPSFNARDLALSSDGRHLVYTAGAQSQLMVRALDRLDAVPLAGIANARAPFLSPDGRWVGFFDQSGELKKVSITGGPPVAVCRVSGTSRGASWGEDDTIVFATSETSNGLLRVPAGGGEPRVLTTADSSKNEQDHYFPSVLPGGRGVLFTIISGGVADSHVAVLDLKTGQYKTVIPGGSQAEYVETGHLVYMVGRAGVGTMRRNFTLWGVRFDPIKLEVVGDPAPIVDQIRAGNFSVSEQGTLVYVPVGTGTSRSLVWVSRQGEEETLAAPPGAYQYPRLSPDGTRVAVTDGDIWTWDLARRTWTRLTFDPLFDSYPVWTPDGQRIVFAAQRTPAASLYWRKADGMGRDEALTTTISSQQRAAAMSPFNQQRPTAISPDGKRLVFEELRPRTAWDLMLLSLDGTAQAEPLLDSPFDERNAAISPDGRWMAYESNESGQTQVYVRPFPNAREGRYQVSIAGGRTPFWAPNGRELFIVQGTSLFSVGVRPTPAFSAGNPAKLFDGRFLLLDVRSFEGMTGRMYDVSRDGQRFLMIRDTADSREDPSMVVVQNWFEEVKAKVPAAK